MAEYFMLELFYFLSKIKLTLTTVIILKIYS